MQKSMKKEKINKDKIAKSNPVKPSNRQFYLYKFSGKISTRKTTRECYTPLTPEELADEAIISAKVLQNSFKCLNCFKCKEAQEAQIKNL